MFIEKFNTLSVIWDAFGITLQLANFQSFSVLFCCNLAFLYMAHIHDVTSDRVKNSINEKMCFEWAGGMIKQIKNSDNKNVKLF